MESGAGFALLHRHGDELRRARHPHGIRRHRGRLAARACRKVRRFDGAGLRAGAAGDCTDQFSRFRQSDVQAQAADSVGRRTAPARPDGPRAAPAAGVRAQGGAMSSAAGQAARLPRDAIFVDEIGIEYRRLRRLPAEKRLSADLRARGGTLGGGRRRRADRAASRRQGGRRAGVLRWHCGRAIACSSRRMCRQCLHLSNFRNIGVEGLDAVLRSRRSRWVRTTIPGARWLKSG